METYCSVFLIFFKHNRQSSATIGFQEPKL